MTTVKKYELFEKLISKAPLYIKRTATPEFVELCWQCKNMLVQSRYVFKRMSFETNITDGHSRKITTYTGWLSKKIHVHAEKYCR